MGQTGSTYQIEIFRSALALVHYMDKVLDMHKAELERYEEELGLMLRQTGRMQNNSEVANALRSGSGAKDKQALGNGTFGNGNNKKKMMMMKEKQKQKMRKPKKKLKLGKTWTNYREILIFRGNVNEGKTEVYFETINELKNHIELLKKAKQTLSQLATAGINDAYYLVVIKHGVPRKLVLVPHGSMAAEKFAFQGNFVSPSIEAPIENLG